MTSAWRRQVVTSALALVALTLATVPTAAAASGSSAARHASSLAASGYAVIDAAGGVITYGGAGFDGDLLANALNAAVVGAASDPGGGYWMDAADGGVFAFGAAAFYGSMGGRTLNMPIVGMAATPDGGGYWLVAADGGVFAFGDARFDGSTGSLSLNRPIVGMQASANGSGYWLVGSDGGVFSFGAAPFHGSLGDDPPGSPIVAMTTTPDEGGYWMVGRDDSVYAFGDADYDGGASSPLHPPLYPASVSSAIPAGVAIVALPEGQQAAHTGGVRVAFLGDSLAWYEGYYTSADHPGYLIDNGSVPGCGVTNGTEMQMWSTPGEYESSVPACTDWAAQMQWVIERYHPDSVVIQLGYWEEQNRLWDGSYVNLSDPAFAAYIEGNIDQAATIAHASGANVILTTSPYFGDGTPDWAVNDFNDLIEAVATEDSSFVSALNVNRLLSPAGNYVQDLDGALIRTSDNVHLTSSGVQRFIDPELNLLANSLGEAIYDGGS